MRFEVDGHLGLSENNVPLHPMVLLIMIPFLNGYFIGGIPHLLRHTHLLPTNKRGRRTLGPGRIGTVISLLGMHWISVNYWKRKPYTTLKRFRSR